MSFATYYKNTYEGAGFVFITPQNKVLILQKNNSNWTFPGGHAELYEEPLETAKRECMEELGIIPKGEILTYIEYIKSETKNKCFSFIMKIKKEFTPKISHEHKKYDWVKINKLKKLSLSKAVIDLLPKLLDLNKI